MYLSIPYGFPDVSAVKPVQVKYVRTIELLNVLNTLRQVKPKQRVIFDGVSQRVMVCLERKYDNQGNLIITWYELPNISNRAYYQLWKDIHTGSHKSSQLKFCSPKWWSNLHWNGKLDKEKTEALQQQVLSDTMLNRLQTKRKTLDNLPKHLMKRRMFVNVTQRQ